MFREKKKKSRGNERSTPEVRKGGGANRQEGIHHDSDLLDVSFRDIHIL
jgi:hypothetical protein